MSGSHRVEYNKVAYTHDGLGFSADIQEGREGGRVEVKYDRRKEVTPVKKRRKEGRDEG